MKDENNTLTIKNCPAGLRRKMKVAAAQEGMTLRDLIIALLESFLEDRK